MILLRSILGGGGGGMETSGGLSFQVTHYMSIRNLGALET